jgi:hypothetical protein
VIIVDGAPKRTISTVRSLELTTQLEILSEQYLGETTNRKDSIFRGMRGRIELHLENDDIFDLQQAVVDKARKRSAGTKVNIKATLAFPNGDRPRVLIPDCEFGELPLNFGSRSDYGLVTLEFEASEFQIIA